MALDVKVYVNCGVKQQIRTRVLKRGFNRVIDGPTWGLRRAAKKISDLAREESIDLQVAKTGFTKLETRLQRLGILLISFPQGISQRETEEVFRGILYKGAIQRSRSSLDYKSALEYLGDLLTVLPNLDAKMISDLLSQEKPIDRIPVGEYTYTVTDGPPGSGARYLLEESHEETGIKYEYMYAKEQIGRISDLLDRTGNKKEEILRLLKDKNPKLFAALLSSQPPRPMI